MKQMNEAEAIAYANSGDWSELSDIEFVELQLNQTRVCVPWGLFRKKIEQVLGYRIWTHEFAMPRRIAKFKEDLERIKKLQKL